MLTIQDINTMKQRKLAVLSALKFFTDVKDVKSSNIPGFESDEASDIITAYRADYGISIMSYFVNAVRTGVGNCTELSAIVYASLSGNPRLINNSTVTVCGLPTDHAIIIVTEKYGAMPLLSWHKLDELSRTTMVVDPWTRDWYFPNLDPTTVCRYGLYTMSLLTPWQIHIRNVCKTSVMRNYTNIAILPRPKNPKIWPKGEYSFRYK